MMPLIFPVAVLIVVAIAAIVVYIIEATKKADVTPTDTPVPGADVAASNFSTVSSKLTKIGISIPAGTIYTSPIEKVGGYGTLSLLLKLASGTGTLHMDLMMDESGDHLRTKTVSIGQLPTEAHTLSMISHFFRIRIVAITDIVDCSFQTIYHGAGKHLTSTINEKITDANDVELVRSVITASTQSGAYKNVKVDHEGNLGVSIRDPSSAFGDVMTSTIRPIFQISSVYNFLDPQWWQSFNASGGNSTVDNGLISLNTTSTAGSYAVIRSKKRLHYHPGLGAGVRFTTAFNVGVPLSTQQVGLASGGNGYIIGYDGDKFGVMRRSGGRYETRTLTVTLTTVGGTVSITLNGVVIGPITLAAGTAQFTAHQITASPLFLAAGWNVDHVGATVIFSARGLGSKSGTYSLTSTVTSGTFALNTAGRLSTETWDYQSTFSEDIIDGTGDSAFTINPQKGNVYEIMYQWLGFGAISFRVENPITGRFFTFHKVTYSNKNDIPSTEIPSFPISFSVASLGSTTPMSLGLTSCLGYLQGNETIAAPKYTVSTTKTIAAGEKNLIALYSPTTYKGLASQVQTLITKASVATEGTKNVTLSCYLNPTTLGANLSTDFDSWVYSDVNSATVYDITSITHTGGINLFSVVLGKVDSLSLELFKDDITLEVGDVLLFTVNSTATTDVSISINWLEDK